LKHKLEDDVNININLPKQDLEDLIDKATNAAITIIATVTFAQIVKSIFTMRSS
jgi:hypothetical protein